MHDRAYKLISFCLKVNCELPVDPPSASVQDLAESTMKTAQSTHAESSLSIAASEGLKGLRYAQLQTMIELGSARYSGMETPIATIEGSNPWNTPVRFGCIPSHRSKGPYKKAWGILVWSDQRYTVPEGYANLGVIRCIAPDRYLETRGDEKQLLASSRAIRKRFNLEGIQGFPKVSRDTIFSYLSHYCQPTPESVAASPPSSDSTGISQSSTSELRDIIDREPTADSSGSKGSFDSAVWSGQITE